ncbi:MAG: hypothetical protein ACKOWD_03420 [Rhodoferax sp.]
MNTMTITIERTPRTFKFRETTITVEELSITLPFGRKSVNIDELCASGIYQVFVTETRTLTPEEFDRLGRTLLISRDWLRGKGGSIEDGMLCVEVTAPGRPYLYINPEGTDYGRYVARLG